MNQINENFEEYESFDVRKIIAFFLNYWKWIFLGVFIAVILAFLYVRYSTPEYQSTAKVLIKGDSDGKSISSLQLEGFGLLGEGIGAESEAEILKSRQIIGRVVDAIDLTTVVYTYGGFTKIKKTELYVDNSPIWITVLDEGTGYFAPFEMKAKANNKGSFTLEIEGDHLFEVNNGDTIEYQGVTLLFNQSSDVKVDPSQLFEFLICTKEDAISNLINSISINRDQITEGILGISVIGLSREKNNKILNELIFQQQKSAIDQKNLTAKKTNEFLTNRLMLIEQKLDSIENIGRAIKSANNIIDIPSELPSMLAEERELEAEFFELSVSEGLAKQMIDFFNSNDDFQSLVPVNLSFNSTTLNTSIGEYNQLVLERNNLLASSNESNPLVVKRKNDIIRLRANLKTSVETYLSSIVTQKKRVQSKLNQFISKKSSIPKYELDYRDAMRDQSISESIYLMLLQKKEENEIILASTESNIRVIDYAYSGRFPVSPNKGMVFILAGLFGIIVPTGFFYVRGLLDNKLKNIEELESMGLPVMGDIPLTKLPLTEILEKNSRNSITEAFISVRTNIGFILDNSKSNVVMVTSSIAGEGKTFVTLNLAKAYSAAGKKVVVLGLDLRAPKLLEYLNIPYTIGASNYLSNDKVSLNSIIYSQEILEDVDFIPCGSIPPNPSELLVRNRFKELISELKEKYDLVLIDTSPIGLVADTLSISDAADLLVYVARAGYLKRDFLSLPKKLYFGKKFKALSMLVNGVEDANSGYGYGYGYLEDDAKKGKKGFNFLNKRNNS